MGEGKEMSDKNMERSIELFNQVQLYILKQANLRPDTMVKLGNNRNYLSLHKMRSILIEAIQSVDKGGYFEIFSFQENGMQFLSMRVFLGNEFINLCHKERYLGHSDFEKALKEAGVQNSTLNAIEQQITISQSYAKRRLMSNVFGIDEHIEEQR